MNTGPYWILAKFLSTARSLGVIGVELFPIEHWSMLKKYDLMCAATKTYTFIRGMNNKNHHPECCDALEKAMIATSAAGFPDIMTFTGLSDNTGESNGSLVSKDEAFKK